jgi:putative ABC transport system permease protein
MRNIWQDVRYGVRMLLKHRLTTLVCVVALALGIGVNTAMFSVAEAFLLHPVPFDHSSGIVALVDSRPGQSMNPEAVAPATYFEWQAQAHSFEKMAGYAWNELNLTGDGQPEKVNGFAVSPSFFDLVDVQPMMGRTFLSDEDQKGKDYEIILSYALWQSRYASDPNILGKNIKVYKKTFTVVGVMKKGFDFPLPAQAWVPLSFDVKERAVRDTRSIWVLGKLRPNITIAEAAAEMSTITHRQAETYPDAYKSWQLSVLPLPQFVTSQLTRQFTLLLMGAVGFVLLIACADVANVQFARVTGRQKELAVRAALGASRFRVIRQLLVESVLLALCGAVLGLFLAQWDIHLILQYMPPDVARFVAGWKTISLDTNAFLFTLVIAIVSGVISGIAPSLLSSAAQPSETLKETGRGTTSGRSRHILRSFLVVGEIALALILLVGAGLLVKSFAGLLNANETYHPESILTLKVILPEAQYGKKTELAAFYDQTAQRLASIPGVESTALATGLPYADGGWVDERRFSIEGRAAQKRGEIFSAIVETISPSYFHSLNIGLRDGRELKDSDGSQTLPVAVVSNSLAQRYFPGENAIGRKIKVGAQEDTDSQWMTIVGIVDDVHYSWINKELSPTLYRSYRQAPPRYASLVLRTHGDPTSFTAAVRSQIAAVDPDLPISDVKSFHSVITESIVGISYVAAMMGVLGIIALVLASLGIYGVMSYSVGERTHEIGVRMAMGASANDIQKLVLGRGTLLTVLGIAIGLPLAFALANALSGLLFEVKAADPTAFVGLPLILAAVSLLASYLPARRALRVDPIVALRHE